MVQAWRRRVLVRLAVPKRSVLRGRIQGNIRRSDCRIRARRVAVRLGPDCQRERVSSL